MDKSSKTQISIAIIGGIFLIVAAVISSPHWSKFFFPNQYLEKEKISSTLIQKDTSKIKQDSSSKEIVSLSSDKEKNTSNKSLKDSLLNIVPSESGIIDIRIDKLDLCPVNSKIPSYFFLQIKNYGTCTLKDLKLQIILGRSKYYNIDILGPRLKEIKVDTSNSEIIEINALRVYPNETYSIYSLLSQPSFSSILISGKNLSEVKEYKYSDYITSSIKDRTSDSSFNGFKTFLYFLFGAILIVLSIYFLSIIFTLLKKWLEWQ